MLEIMIRNDGHVSTCYIEEGMTIREILEFAKVTNHQFIEVFGNSYRMIFLNGQFINDKLDKSFNELVDVFDLRSTKYVLTILRKLDNL